MMRLDVRRDAIEIRVAVPFHGVRVFKAALMPFGINRMLLLSATRMASEAEDVVPRAPRVGRRETWLT